MCSPRTPAGSPEISGVTSSPQFVSSNDTVPIEEPTPLASIVLTVARGVSAHAAEAMASTNADASSSRGSIQPITFNRALTASGWRLPTERAFTAAGQRRAREQSKLDGDRSVERVLLELFDERCHARLS